MKVTRFFWSVRTSRVQASPHTGFPFMQCLNYCPWLFVVNIVVAFRIRHCFRSICHWSPLSFLLLLWWYPGAGVSWSVCFNLGWCEGVEVHGYRYYGEFVLNFHECVLFLISPISFDTTLIFASCLSCSCYSPKPFSEWLVEVAESLETLNFLYCF